MIQKERLAFSPPWGMTQLYNRSNLAPKTGPVVKIGSRNGKGHYQSEIGASGFISGRNRTGCFPSASNNYYSKDCSIARGSVSGGQVNALVYGTALLVSAPQKLLDGQINRNK